MGVRQDIIASKSAIATKLNVSNEGILTVGYGGVYISVDVVTDVSLAETTGTAVASISKAQSSFVTDVDVNYAVCEACGEEPFVTSVSAPTATALTAVTAVNGTFVTGTTLTKTTEEHLMPVMFDDEFGNTHPVVMGTNRGDGIRTIDATPAQGTTGEGTPDTG